jgi:hypothetical protein
VGCFYQRDHRIERYSEIVRVDQPPCFVSGPPSPKHRAPPCLIEPCVLLEISIPAISIDLTKLNQQGFYFFQAFAFFWHKLRLSHPLLYAITLDMHLSGATCRANNAGGVDDDAWPNHPCHNVALHWRSPLPSRVSLLPKTRSRPERMKLLFSCPFISFPKKYLTQVFAFAMCMPISVGLCLWGCFASVVYPISLSCDAFADMTRMPHIAYWLTRHGEP